MAILWGITLTISKFSVRPLERTHWKSSIVLTHCTRLLRLSLPRLTTSSSSWTCRPSSSTVSIARGKRTPVFFIMGIPRLTATLQPYSDCRALKDEVVVIDGPALAYHILHVCRINDVAQPSYRLVALSTLAWLNELSKHEVAV